MEHSDAGVLNDQSNRLLWNLVTVVLLAITLMVAAGLRFSGCRSPELLAFEQGYVKEGVGAGGLAALWQLSGRSPDELAALCDRACALLR